MSDKTFDIFGEEREGLLASNVGDTNKDAPFPSRGRKGEWVGLSVNPLDCHC